MNLEHKQPINLSPKIQEYVDRVNVGNSKEEMEEIIKNIGDIPQSWLDQVRVHTIDKLPKESKPEIDLFDMPMIPSNLVSLIDDPETLKNMWTISVYADPAIREKMEAWRERGVEYAKMLQEEKKQKQIIIEREKNDKNEIEKIRTELQLSLKTEQQQKAEQITQFFDIDMKDVDKKVIEKAQQYAQQIKDGKSKEYVLQGATQYMIQLVEKMLIENTNKEVVAPHIKPLRENKEYREGSDWDEKMIVDIHNGFNDLAAGAAEGLRDSANEMIERKVNEIISGAPREKVLEGLPPSLTKAIEDRLNNPIA